MTKPYTGFTESRYDNGGSYIQANFEDGYLHGNYTVYYPSGQKMGVSYYKIWFKTGNLHMIKSFDEGELEWEEYYNKDSLSVENNL